MGSVGSDGTRPDKRVFLAEPQQPSPALGRACCGSTQPLGWARNVPGQSIYPPRALLARTFPNVAYGEVLKGDYSRGPTASRRRLPFTRAQPTEIATDNAEGGVGKPTGEIGKADRTSFHQQNRPATDDLSCQRPRKTVSVRGTIFASYPAQQDSLATSLPKPCAASFSPSTVVR